MPSGIDTAKAVEALSVQALADQLEAGIVSAHGKVSMILGEGEDAMAQPESPGAMLTLHRCESELERLNRRLQGLLEKTGRL